MNFSVEIFKNDETHYTARCVELELYSFGKTSEEASERLEHIITFYLSSLDELGVELETDDWDFVENGYFSTPDKFSIPNYNEYLQ